jgi:hypothetical protein
MKVRLIEPAPRGMNTFSMILLPRLGLPIIGTLLRQQGHDVKIYAPQMAPVVWPDVYDADLVGIPVRVTVGKKLAEGKVEVFRRSTRESRDATIGEILEVIAPFLRPA